MKEKMTVSGGFGDSIGISYKKPTLFQVPVTVIPKPTELPVICEYRLSEGGICGELATNELVVKRYKNRTLPLCKKHSDELYRVAIK